MPLQLDYLSPWHIRISTFADQPQYRHIESLFFIWKSCTSIRKNKNCPWKIRIQFLFQVTEDNMKTGAAATLCGQVFFRSFSDSKGSGSVMLLSKKEMLPFKPACLIASRISAIVQVSSSPVTDPEVSIHTQISSAV